jgi:RNA-directed DNA polymerase
MDCYRKYPFQSTNLSPTRRQRVRGERVVDAGETLKNLDAHIRRRLRAIQLKHWKCKRTIARKLIGLGVRPKTAWRRVYEGRKSLWALSHNTAVHRGLRNAYFAERDLVSVADLWKAASSAIEAPRQLELQWG